ncbi:MAG: PAS domain S-box protein [Spirochaetes bacterium]|nr:PAS domain S-box protein [Spirochaetota bacterium]
MGNLYESIFNNTQDGIAVIGGHNMISECNHALEKITGYSRNEILGYGYADFLKNILKVRETADFTEKSRFRITTKNNEKRTVRVSAVKPDSDAETIVYFHDITACTEMREKDKTLYRNIFDSANDAILIMEDSKFTDCNGKTLEIFGVSAKKDIINHGLWEFSPAKQPDGSDSFIKAAEIINTALSGTPRRFYWKHKKADGSLFDTEVSLNRIKGYRGYLLAMIRDITFTRQTGEQLKKLRITMEQSPVSIVITDLDGNIEYINPKFSEITGYSLEEVRGKNPRILKSGETSDGEYKKLWETITGGRIWRGEFHNLKKNGQLYWESAVIAPVKDDNGKITNFIGVKEDITELKRLQNQLIMAQKMESIGNLTGGIAHDFNNILTAINGNAELILTDLKKGDPLYEEIRAIYESGGKAAELVSKLLAFSRRQIIKPQIIDINTIIDNLFSILPRIIGENISLKKKLSNTLYSIEADPSQIDQILINLAVNARDAVNNNLPGKTEKLISFETRNVTITEDYIINHPGSYKGNFVLFSVSDNGTGMDEDVKRKVFEPFFTTKGKERGTGMGLSTVYGIVKQNHGFIYIYSEMNRGSVFKVYWPACAEKTPDKTNHTERAVPAQGGETIMLVEDDESVLRFTERALKTLGYTILTANNGKEALSLITGDTEAVDLVISDVVMPEMGGIELAEKIRELKPETKFLFTSGYTESELKNTNLIQKPYSISELSKYIEEIISEGKK